MKYIMVILALVGLVTKSKQASSINDYKVKQSSPKVAGGSGNWA